MSITTVSVVGGGQMGSGIAQVAAQAGQTVIIVEINPEILLKTQKTIQSSLTRVAKKMFNRDAQRMGGFVGETLGRITMTTNLEEGATSDLIIEAIVERLDAKRELFMKLDAIAPHHTIFATNTSSLSVTDIAADVTRKDRFCGLHFFNPVPVMQLLEVIRTDHTSDGTYQAVIEWGATIGKTCITCKDKPGFVVNRLLAPFYTEAMRMVDRGDATKEDIDTAMMLGAGHPMGPFRLLDFTGLDTVKLAMQASYEKTGDPNKRPIPMLDRLVAEGKLGIKTGEGFYKYTRMAKL